MGLSCQILIDRPHEGFHRAGWPITGVIKYALDVPTEYKDIKLALQGESYCSWTETDSDNNSTRYTGRETILCQVVSLLNCTNRKLPAGAYEHKFIFTLPKRIPPSFKQSTGYVCYQIILEFKKNRIFSPTKTFTADIIVRSCLELTLLNTPTVFGLDKNLFKPLSFGNQRIVLKAAIARPYIKPGKKVEIKFMIVNDTTVDIKGIRAELIRHTIFTAKCSRQNIKVQSVKQCTVESVEIPSRSNANLTVRMPTSYSEWTVQHSNVIRNEYQIEVTVRLPIPHRNATTVMPILLGERDIPVEVGIDIANVMERTSLPPHYTELAHYTETRNNNRTK